MPARSGGRGGFDRIRSQGSDEPIMFRVCYREEPLAQLITYWLSIDADDVGRPYVHTEILSQQGGIESGYSTRGYLILRAGIGVAWRGESEGQGISENVGGGFDFVSIGNFYLRIMEIANKFEDTEVEEALRAADEDAGIRGDAGETARRRFGNRSSSKTTAD